MAFLDDTGNGSWRCRRVVHCGRAYLSTRDLIEFFVGEDRVLDVHFFPPRVVTLFRLTMITAEYNRRERLGFEDDHGGLAAHTDNASGNTIEFIGSQFDGFY